MQRSADQEWGVLCGAQVAGAKEERSEASLAWLTRSAATKRATLSSRPPPQPDSSGRGPLGAAGWQGSGPEVGWLQGPVRVWFHASRGPGGARSALLRVSGAWTAPSCVPMTIAPLAFFNATEPGLQLVACMRLSCRFACSLTLHASTWIHPENNLLTPGSCQAPCAHMFF